MSLLDTPPPLMGRWDHPPADLACSVCDDREGATVGWHLDELRRDLETDALVLVRNVAEVVRRC